MPNDTKENEIESKLEYIGLDLNNIPDFLKNAKRVKYQPLKIGQKNMYQVYQYVPISKIKILLSPCNRLHTIAEKYAKAESISAYLDETSEKHVIEHTQFLKMLKQVKIEEIQAIEIEQKKWKKQIPFLVKFKENYLWQIYYSDIEHTYFMIVPTEDLEYAAFFYLLKKQIQCKENKKEEYVYVPISYKEQSGQYLTKIQSLDLEKYLWQFTKYWPITYEVQDEKQNLNLHIVGETKIYENMKSDYKIVLETKQEAQTEYQFLKALFLLTVELPNYFTFQAKVSAKGGLEFEYHQKKVTYESLMQLLITEYEKAKKNIQNSQNQIQLLTKQLQELQQENRKKEQEYLAKERCIATYLECKKTFLGRVKYFWKSKKIKRNTRKETKDNQQFEKREIQKEEEHIEFVQKEYYTIEDMIDICHKLDQMRQTEKNLQIDTQAQKQKLEMLSKKIQNASLYIEQIDRHKKSIFEFWKFASQDDPKMLQASTGDISAEEPKLEKIYHFEEDFEELTSLLDKNQRNILSKEETDDIFLAIQMLEDLKDTTQQKWQERLEKQKEEAKQERMLFQNEHFDLFGNVASDHTKIQLLAGKKHRETQKDKWQLLDITKYTSQEEYQTRIEELSKHMNMIFEKVTSPVSIPAYALLDELDTSSIQVFYLDPKEALLEQKQEKQVSLYRINIQKEMKVLYATNSIYYDNYNKTLPLGMNITTKCLLRSSDYEWNLQKKETIRKVESKEDGKVIIKKIKIYEYDITRRIYDE